MVPIRKRGVLKLIRKMDKERWCGPRTAPPFPVYGCGWSGGLGVVLMERALISHDEMYSHSSNDMEINRIRISIFSILWVFISTKNPIYN